MKIISILMLILVTFTSFANESSFGVSPKNQEISNEIKSRITDGIFSGRSMDSESCTVEINGTSINIKTNNFRKEDPRGFDCLENENISCFEFSASRYLSQKTLFFNGDLFSAKVVQENDQIFQLTAKRNLGGAGKYKLAISKIGAGTNVSIEENQSSSDGPIRKLDCTINF